MSILKQSRRIAKRRFASRQDGINMHQSRQDPLDIAVDDVGGPAEGDGGNGGGGIGPDPRQGQQAPAVRSRQETAGQRAGGGAARPDVAALLPAGNRILGIAGVDGRLAVWVEGPEGARVLLLDGQGRQVGQIGTR